MRILASLLLVAGLAPASGLANEVTVGCQGLPGDYPTIGAALTALRAISPGGHRITVIGTCTEFVDLSGMADLTLAGTSTTSIESAVNGPTNLGWIPTIRMTGAINIVIRDLLVSGGLQNTAITDAVQVVDSTLTVMHSVMEHGYNGLDLRGHSHVTLGAQVTVRDNTGVGILTEDTSTLTVNSNSAANKLVIAANGIGINAVGRSTVSIPSVAEIRDNPNYGVYAAGGAVTVGGGSGQVVMSGNGVGLAATGAGTVRQLGSGQLIVQNSTNAGISSWHGGAILLMNAVIEKNGSVPSAFPFDAAVLVDVNASIVLVNVTIRDNPVTALYVRDGAVAQLQGVTIAGNAADGIRVETLSGVRFQGAASTVKGNGGTDIVCDPDTYVVGAAAADIGRARCRSIRN